jgi:hypothetical protein
VLSKPPPDRLKISLSLLTEQGDSIVEHFVTIDCMERHFGYSLLEQEQELDDSLMTAIKAIVPKFGLKYDE